MSYFVDSYQKKLVLSDFEFSAIVNGSSNHVVCPDQNVHIGSVIALEPKQHEKINQENINKGNLAGLVREYGLITSVQTVGDVRICGFKRLDDLPRPFARLIDALHAENKALSEALSQNGINPKLVIAKGLAA